MGSVKRRMGAGFAVLMLLFAALVTVQMLVADRLQLAQQRHADRSMRALDANSAVLQNMTDAETGVRGFQLTGERVFLEPYDSGRVGAFTAFDQVARLTRDATVRRLLGDERRAAAHWLDGYATPIVTAGRADADAARADRGKAMFDQLRAANARVDAAIRGEQRAIAGADRRQARIVQLVFGGLAAAFLLVAIVLATVHQRHLLDPLEHIRQTLRRLAAGDHAARAVPAGPGEMRAVIGTLNHLAAQTQRLLDAEHARSLRNELRQAVAAELRTDQGGQVIGERVVELIGTALGADAVHGRVSTGDGDGLAVSWPPGVPALPAAAVAQVLDGTPGRVLTVTGPTGAIAVPLDGGTGAPGGLLCLVRGGDPEWTGDERRLLGSLGREVEYAVRQRVLARRQDRLISELRALDERKDAFVATVTHELRTPLTSILGYVEMLSDGDGGELSPLQQRGVAAILRNALRLQDTIGDLLLLDRAQRGVAAPEPVDLAAVVAGVYLELAPTAQAKDLVLTVDTQPVRVNGDAVELQRAVRGLVENAIKFTGAGGHVECRLAADGDRAVLTVTDTGIGIPADDVPGLFTPFHRAANAMHQAVQGTGLGLAIVQNIVTEHGGTVAARSRVNEGSTFTITLPGEPAPDEPRDSSVASGAVG